MKIYTDSTITELGDNIDGPSIERECKIVSWGGSMDLTIEVDGGFFGVRKVYVYKKTENDEYIGGIMDVDIKKILNENKIKNRSKVIKKVLNQ
jgi:hypothetical protein